MAGDSNNKKSALRGYHRYGRYGSAENEEISALCDKMSFANAEAYKMLRTKLNLIMPEGLTRDDTSEQKHECRVIGVSSSMRGEGKTTTSINLAYTIAETKKRVCLVEADMRLPNIGKRLELKETPGLSNVLSGQCSIRGGLQKYAAKNGVSFYVITAGDIPPTPSELLESQNMDMLLAELRQIFDVIIIDLPPVSAVTDALSVAPRLNGMLVVVRVGYCDKRLLTDTMYQFELTGTKILGVVATCSDGLMSNPGRYSGKYYRGYRRYGYGYKGAYEYQRSSEAALESEEDKTAK